MIVSDIAGTTRDAVDTYIENEYGRFTFIDTAGIRRKSKVLEMWNATACCGLIWLWTGRMSA